MSVHTIRIEQGVVSQPVEVNKNPSIAESPTQARGQSPVGVALKSAAFIQSAKQIRDGVIGNIGYATGNYELQEKAETVTKVGATIVGLAAAPLATTAALTISTGFEIYKVNKTQQRNQYRQQQAQVLTGKIVVNSGVYV
jgi:orotate phosphoribosyltransferase-like protein